MNTGEIQLAEGRRERLVVVSERKRNLWQHLTMQSRYEPASPLRTIGSVSVIGCHPGQVPCHKFGWEAVG
ncbi:hypothetical protein MPNT_200036 [Candidatus Methylacidithermus pantelleriae]|uniref:Uncharacterized protein n=1 Tax=Candidatus Methylacidithermus pantelleriae TaxID=2744239 RepID=A0A8J2BI81_9BACT|nr:hypothetical protein MPNT_200036 [Candidatus Methylacidithermus pantelleriae]